MSVTTLKQKYIEAVQLHQMNKYALSLAIFDAIEAECKTSPRIQHFRALNLVTMEEMDKALVALERQAQLINIIKRNSRRLREHLPQEFVKELNESLNDQFVAYEQTRFSIEQKGAYLLDKKLVQHMIADLKRELEAQKRELEHHRRAKKDALEAFEQLKREHPATAKAMEQAQEDRDDQAWKKLPAMPQMVEAGNELHKTEKMIAEVLQVIQTQELRISQMERLIRSTRMLDSVSDSPVVRALLMMVSGVSGIIFVASLFDNVSSEYLDQPGQPLFQSERMLHFPANRSLGALYVRDALDFGESEWIPFADEAQGSVPVNERLEVHLRMREATPENMQALQNLPPNGLHSIWLPEFSASAEKLAALQHFSTLEELIIDEATSPEEFDRIQQALPGIRLEILPPAAIAEAEARTAPEAQRFAFPTDRVVGRVMVRPWALAESDRWEELAIAQGVVNTPEGHEVKLELNQAAGSDLSFLADLAPDALHTLSLTGSQVNNDDVEYIRQLTGLRGLELRFTSLTDEGLLRLSILSLLEEVTLQRINMTDTGFAVFVNFPNMRVLIIRHAQLSNRSIPVIRQMRGLRMLHLEQSGISREGLITLSFDLPQATVSPMDW